MALRKKILIPLLLAALAFLASPSGASGPPVPVGPGDRAPSMVLADTAGIDRDISRPLNDGGNVIIFFWSVFCSNCKEAMPLLLDLNTKWAQKGLTIWAVNVDGDRFSNAVKAFLDEATLPYPVVYDRLDGEYLIAADPLEVSKTPTIIVIGKTGIIKLRQEINLDIAEVEKSIADPN